MATTFRRWQLFYFSEWQKLVYINDIRFPALRKLHVKQWIPKQEIISRLQSTDKHDNHPSKEKKLPQITFQFKFRTTQPISEYNVHRPSDMVSKSARNKYSICNTISLVTEIHLGQRILPRRHVSVSSAQTYHIFCYIGKNIEIVVGKMHTTLSNLLERIIPLSMWCILLEFARVVIENLICLLMSDMNKGYIKQFCSHLSSHFFCCLCFVLQNALCPSRRWHIYLQ